MQSRWIAIALFVVAACARLPTPADPTASVLFRDLERHVTVGATTGWGVDRLEIDGLLEGALDSVCRVHVLARRSLREWLDAEIRRLGGPVDEAFRARGRDLSKVDDLLVVTRISKLLARAEELANECPFWLEPEEPFRGRQVSARRWQLSLGGGGKGIVVQQGDRLDLSAGGAGRLLVGRTFVDGDALYAGLEIGASASLPKDEMGERTALVIGIDFVAPIVYRRNLTNTYLEVDAGWLARSTENDWAAIDHGIHVGFAVGARALRTRFVFPGAALGLSWERSFVDGTDITLLKVGARVTFDLDL